MIFDFDTSETREKATSAYNALGSINTKLTVSASYRAFSRLLSGLGVFIII